MRNIRDDRGAARLATFTWLFVVLAIVGVLAYNGFSIMSTRVSTENDAQTAAYAASQAWHNTRNLDSAYAAAVASVQGKHEKVLTRGFTIDPDGTAHLMLRSDAKTVVLGHIKSLRHYEVAVEHGDANSIN